MLQKLSIRNYAIIDQLSLSPDEHLNTVTGETGAGKSIILGALSLILGDRVDTSVLINKEEKCVVEAYFEVGKNTVFRKALRDAELDDEPLCIIRREIGVSGKSRAFVNDTPVNLSMLNKLTSLLVDLHQQFDHLALQSDSFQLDVLDAVAKAEKEKAAYRSSFRKLREVTAELSALQAEQARWQKEADYKQFLLDELQQASFKEEEIENAEIQLKSLTHAERIQAVLTAAVSFLQEGEQPVITELRKVVQQLQGIGEWLPASSVVTARLASAFEELRDLSQELESLQDTVNLDEGLMQSLQERVDLGYRLFKKHDVRDTAALITLKSGLEEELKASLDISDKIEALGKQQLNLSNEVNDAGQALSKMRGKVSPAFAKEVTRLLSLVGMPNARFDIRLTRSSHPGPEGIDDVSFVLDANKSGQFQSLHKAASGGEMSRIMLSIKSLTAQAMQLPTLIFDEVDTGISGEAARQVGILLRDLSKYHQVICITHQPQVAARGTRHFFVYKDALSGGRITTKVRVLEDEERVLSIAQMTGGETPTQSAIDHAREMIASETVAGMS